MTGKPERVAVLDTEEKLLRPKQTVGGRVIDNSECRQSAENDMPAIRKAIIMMALAS